jgi:lipoprotein-releasing system permease protein
MRNAASRIPHPASDISLLIRQEKNILLQSKDFFHLNTEFFLAKRLVSRSKGSFSWTFVVIAITSIALGLAIMFVAVAILTGFKKEIREKVVGFGGHIQITRFAENSSYEPQPIDKHQPFYQKLKNTKEISHIQVYATKAGLLQGQDGGRQCFQGE